MWGGGGGREDGMEMEMGGEAKNMGFLFPPGSPIPPFPNPVVGRDWGKSTLGTPGAGKKSSVEEWDGRETQQPSFLHARARAVLG